ncbi:ubiquitin carboxyl-terminal hydrolase [Phycomyces blakesleeanus]
MPPKTRLKPAAVTSTKLFNKQKTGVNEAPNEYLYLKNHLNNPEHNSNDLSENSSQSTSFSDYPDQATFRIDQLCTQSYLTKRKTPIDNWHIIESDHDVFTKMIKSYGIRDIIAREVVTLNFDELRETTQVYGLIFVSDYKDQKSNEYAAPNDPDDPDDPEVKDFFFATKVVKNACATAALLSVLLNCDSSLETCKELKNLNRLSKRANSDDVGAAIGKSKMLRETNNSLSSPEINTVSSSSECSDYHFVSYVFKNGFLWETDSTKSAPVKIKLSPAENWVDSVKGILEELIERTPFNNSFNLIAIVHDELSSYKRLFHEKNMSANAYRNRIKLEKKTLEEAEKSSSTSLEYTASDQLVTKHVLRVLTKKYTKIEADLTVIKKKILKFTRKREEERVSEKEKVVEPVSAYSP